MPTPALWAEPPGGHPGPVVDSGMPRLEDVLAELARAPGARAAALAGFDGLLVDEAFAPAGGAADAAPHALEGAPESLGDTDPPALDGAVVELTHAWNAVRRATAEFLAAGEARELLVRADGGLLATRRVADGWFVLLWAAPDADPAVARDAVRLAGEHLAEVVG